MAKVKDKFNRAWIIDNALEILENYRMGEITIRGLHYRLVAAGMTNSMTHYSRVKAAMTATRRDGRVAYEQFSDHDREVIGRTDNEETNVKDEVDGSIGLIEHILNNYSKNRWENQIYYPEVWIEKKALIGVFKPVCERRKVLLSPCKGYPSLTFLNDAADRFRNQQSNGKKCIILYFGDYDASGEDIPRSIKENLYKDFGVDVELERILLKEDQVVEMQLPPSPTKSGDSRGVNWDGLGQVELDAVEPNVIQDFCRDAIDEYFDTDLWNELQETEASEEKKYKKKLKKFFIKYKF